MTAGIVHRVSERDGSFVYGITENGLDCRDNRVLSPPTSFYSCAFSTSCIFAKGNGLLSDQKKIFEEIGCINSFPQRSTEVGPPWCPAQIIREAMLEDELFEGPWRNRVLNAPPC